MNEPAQNSDQHVAAISKERLLTLAALTLLGAAVVYFYFKSNSTAIDSQRQNAEIRKKLENNQALLADLKQAELRRLEEQSINMTEVERCLGEVDQAESSLQKLRDQLKAWQATQDELKEGDIGRRVASSSEAVKQYQALQSQPKPDASLPEKYQARLDLLRKPLLEAKSSPIKAYRPGPSFDHTLLQIQQEIADTLIDLRTKNAQLAAIISQAPSEASPAAISLPEALSELENALSISQTKRIAEEMAKVREEFTVKLAEERVATERLKQELEVEKTRRERAIEEVSRRNAIQDLDAQRKEMEERQKLKTARDALERGFQHDLPEIKSLLKPFISDGRTQPGKHTFEMSVDVGPVSLSKLQGAGVLDRSVDAQRLLWSMTTANRTNDRDLGGFPAYIGSQQDWFNKQPTVARAQELLIKYGELMKEKGMLAP